MNTRQRGIVSLGLVLVAAMCIVPPWRIAVEWHTSRVVAGFAPLGSGSESAGWHFIGTPPQTDSLQWDAAQMVVRSGTVHIDGARLLVQLIAVGALAGFAYVLAAGRGAAA
jgi:hypothetical protein